MKYYILYNIKNVIKLNNNYHSWLNQKIVEQPNSKVVQVLSPTKNYLLVFVKLKILLAVKTSIVMINMYLEKRFRSLWAKITFIFLKKKCWVGLNNIFVDLIEKFSVFFQWTFVPKVIMWIHVIRIVEMWKLLTWANHKTKIC